MQLNTRIRRLRASLIDWLEGDARIADALDGTRAAVLMYHRVLPSSEARAAGVEPGMFVTPETFRAHLDVLAERFRILPLVEIVDRLEKGQALPRRTCAITFDDGWLDNLVHAAPHLVATQTPATLFVVTQRVGTSEGFWTDEVVRRVAALDQAAQRELAKLLASPTTRDPGQGILEHLKAMSPSRLQASLDRIRERTPPAASSQRQLLDWTELQTLTGIGIDVESHGATHAILTQVPTDQALFELVSSLSMLRDRGFGKHRLLAYPSGQMNVAVSSLAADAGYRSAVTTYRGLASMDSDLLQLPRLGLHDDISNTRALFHRALRT